MHAMRPCTRYTEQIVGWVKEQSDVPIRDNAAWLTGTLRFTRPAVYRAYRTNIFVVDLIAYAMHSCNINDDRAKLDVLDFDDFQVSFTTRNDNRHHIAFQLGNQGTCNR
jgi:hypothetical protein